MRFVFVADFFASQILGGGELNNDELIKILKNLGHEVVSINSHLVDLEFIERNKNNNFIIANFTNLQPECIHSLYDKKYVIYEHDHKYLKTRDPSQFENYLAPQEQIINYEFYLKAAKVFCQSIFHKEIVEKNLNIDNIVSLGGNLWSKASLELMREISKSDKKSSYAIMMSPIEHKNTKDAISYCQHKDIEYRLIKSDSYERFLNMIGEHKALVFFPKTPETLSRIVVESRMMGLGVVTNKRVGAIYEDWYSLKGEELIDIMISKKDDITTQVIGAFN